ncbi:hypothetical protein EDB84DRAFT_1464237 [Lactarius hengduanensis]|nr:hypothetical protein EDB84DRAFT_1464237 [Lactarius hengduanensis]
MSVSQHHVASVLSTSCAAAAPRRRGILVGAVLLWRRVVVASRCRVGVTAPRCVGVKAPGCRVAAVPHRRGISVLCQSRSAMLRRCRCRSTSAMLLRR